MSALEPTAVSPLPLTAPKRPATTGGGVKETIESILVAFILAFVFRAFVVEAFVIPTGSMAPTLLGAHTRFHCPDCGYDFDVNYQPPQKRGDPESDDPAIPATAGQLTNAIYCPNCGFEMLKDDVKDPPVFYGDRILVLKYLYMLAQPQRWDVVVFKAPIAMTTNYIKRLIGKPGESVMILDGDVYIREPNAKDFVVQPKPKPAQDALWRLVYDNDYHPGQTRDRGNVQTWVQPWTPVDGNGWKVDDSASHGRVFDFNGDHSTSTLRFSPQANPTAQTISDYMVYDQQADPRMIPVRTTESHFPADQTDARDVGEVPVSDLDLRATYQRLNGTGPLEMKLTKRGHTFIAQINPSQAYLFQEVAGKRTQIGAAFPLNNSSRPLRIELSNADYQVTLLIDGDIAAQSSPADFAPDIPALLREFDDHKTPPPGRAEITAANQQGNISHLSLWRDDYYYNDRSGVNWATPVDFPNHVQVLGPDEYFVMGDNSILSYDARCWTTGVHLPAEKLDVGPGRVPGRFLLGKAFYVYWPAGYIAAPFLPAFVPNFGAMRFIH